MILDPSLFQSSLLKIWRAKGLKIQAKWVSYLISQSNWTSKKLEKTENVPELAIVILISPSLCAAPPRRCAVTWWYVPKVQVGGWLIDLLFSTRVIFIIGKRSRIWNSDIIDDLFCFVFVFAVCIIAENHNLWCFLACWLAWRQLQQNDE